MAISAQQLESIVAQLWKFGEDGTEFAAWMHTISSLVRAHGDVGAFRTQALSLWLAGNKAGVEKLVRTMLSGPTRDEQAALDQAEVTAGTMEERLIGLLGRMGFCHGDTLTVHSSTGALRKIVFSDPRLPKNSEGPKD